MGFYCHVSFFDDSQIYGFYRPGKSIYLQSRMSACVGDVGLWMRSNQLQLNTAKTEVLWCALACRQHQIPDDSIMVGLDTVQTVRSIRDLGIHLDTDLSMQTHVTRTVSSCFAVLRQICSNSQSVVHSFSRSSYYWYCHVWITAVRL